MRGSDWLISQLNNYALSPISEERGSEAAGVYSDAGSFGLCSAWRLPLRSAATVTVAFTNMADPSTGLPPADQQKVAKALEHDAEIMSNTQLRQQLKGEPKAIQSEVIRINSRARHVAPQIALLILILVGLPGSFRMMRLPDPRPLSAAEGMAFG